MEAVLKKLQSPALAEDCGIMAVANSDSFKGCGSANFNATYPPPRHVSPR